MREKSPCVETRVGAPPNVSRNRIRYRINRMVMGRPRSAHARSAVSTSAGTLRTVSARQHRSPSESARPPGKERIAPASSASAALSGSMATPAAPSNWRKRATSMRESTSLPTTSARFAAPRTVPAISFATRSPPGSLCMSASTAEASRTVIPQRQRVGAQRAIPQRMNATPGHRRPARATLRLRPADVPRRAAAQPYVGAVDRRGPVLAPPVPLPESPGDPADPSQVWHP